GRLRAQLLLQRFAQRYPVARKRYRSDCDQSRRHPARTCASQGLAHPRSFPTVVIKKLIRKLFGQDTDTAAKEDSLPEAAVAAPDEATAKPRRKKPRADQR